MCRRSPPNAFVTNAQQSTNEQLLQQANILSALPPELLACIFSHLHAQSSTDIAACRLVNYAFNKHSSPFLLRRVIFARRREVIKKSCHPFFHRHVTELVYDGSSYAEAAATDWNQYVEDCEYSPRDSEDAAWTAQQNRDRVAWRELSSFGMRNSVIPGSIDDSMKPGEEGERVDSPNERAVPMLEFHNAFRLGCYTSFANYAQRYTDQHYIRLEGVDTNILAAAFTMLPNLSSVVYTDYRGLARNGESFDACCRRQFGRTLEPQHTGITGPGTTVGDRLFPLLDVLAKVPKARVTSLAIGPHAFEYTGEDTSELADPSHAQNPQYLDISALKDVFLGPDTNLSHILSRLKHLRFAFCYSGHCANENHMRDKMCKLLQASTPQLRSLTLHMMYLFWGGVHEVPKLDNNARFDVFTSVISPLRMPHLHSLSLRRWIFTAGELKAFLAEHATTLRNLHLLGCLCGDDEAMLARWGAQNLALTGVELSRCLSVLDMRSANPHGWRRMNQAEWRQMRPMFTEQEYRELEPTWLDGRTNRVAREQRHEIPPEGAWWKRPAYM
ncbi:hypothetical protein LTR86_011282 [Recurvomyces mirabilis]|nr:hypothetical protein LTR86_011282 [Recurvomyces mirabilis]